MQVSLSECLLKYTGGFNDARPKAYQEGFSKDEGNE